ncbi:hypothetical protein H4O20_07610 [Aequorivita sp. 609]|uniref:hypothetical protein n=1 Tax=Aequorivita TaxID=153265 RepID=UPI00161316E2|nr:MULTISPECIES: hypothetical protein [Aequorivita]MBB6681306.1 hypothetical protein [Aequorivita sp. 609]
MNTKFIILFLISLTPFSSFAQSSNDWYEFETIVYTPKKEITKFIDSEIFTCFNETDIDTSKMQYHLQFLNNNDSIILSFATSNKLITDVAVEWDLLKIRGIFYYRNRLAIIEADHSELSILDKFFTKTCKKKTIKVELDKYGEPICGANYLVVGKKFIFKNRFSSFD